MNNNMKKVIYNRIDVMNSTVSAVATAMGKRETSFLEYLNGKRKNIHFDNMNNFLLKIFTTTEIGMLHDLRFTTPNFDFDAWHRGAILWSLKHDASIMHSGSPLVNANGTTATVQPYVTIEIEGIVSYRIYNCEVVYYIRTAGGQFGKKLFILDWLNNTEKYEKAIKNKMDSPFNFKIAKEKYEFVKERSSDN